MPYPYEVDKTLLDVPLDERNTPEEVALHESMNREYYQAPKIKLRKRNKLTRPRTKREQYYYIKNKIYATNFRLRTAEKKLRMLEIRPKPKTKTLKSDLKKRIESLNIKLSKLVIPEYDRLKD